MYQLACQWLRLVEQTLKMAEIGHSILSKKIVLLAPRWVPSKINRSQLCKHFWTKIKRHYRTTPWHQLDIHTLEMRRKWDTSAIEQLKINLEVHVSVDKSLKKWNLKKHSLYGKRLLNKISRNHRFSRTIITIARPLIAVTREITISNKVQGKRPSSPSTVTS